METAVKYTEHMVELTGLIKQRTNGTVEVTVGRRFDRISVNGSVKYFVDRHTWNIYGAKSSFQYNPRWEYGTLKTIQEFDWFTGFPRSGTPAETAWMAREAEIQKTYKPRGRPKKVVAAAVGAGV